MPENDRARCCWAKGERMTRYHDDEWGYPTRDEAKLYEMLLLEAFQAGLSWAIILNKREAFRAAFDGFDPEKIAEYDESKVAALLGDAAIIRSRRKIEAAIGNARVYLAIRKEFGSFADYLYSFTGGRQIVNATDAFVTRSELSDNVSKDLIRRGMRYMGSVTVYSYLQAVGVINDHERACFRHAECVRA